MDVLQHLVAIGIFSIFICISIKIAVKNWKKLDLLHKIVLPLCTVYLSLSIFDIVSRLLR